jgi:acyl-CoA thioesterase
MLPFSLAARCQRFGGRAAGVNLLTTIQNIMSQRAVISFITAYFVHPTQHADGLKIVISKHLFFPT